MVTTSFDFNANVWSPGNMFGDAYLGQLKGHTCAITDITFLPSQPFVITIDRGQTVRLWDIMNLFCMQVITDPISIE